MAELRRVPPGRAGRLWLRQRLDTAQRGVDLLDRKLRILRTEQEHFRMLAMRTGAEWEHRAREADRWLLRAAVLGGQREIRLATQPPAAEADIEWGTVMGARYPVRVRCKLPEWSAMTRVPGTAAVDGATEAYRAALRAAIAHAGAREACRIIDAEVAETGRRLRTLTDRWIPRLQNAMHTITERLEETERVETTRIRWAAAQSGEPR